jgi:hypothetical protein
VRVVQGILFGYIVGAPAGSSRDSGSGLIVATLLLGIGIFRLITSRQQRRKEDDPDAPSPGWMATISGLSAVKTFGIGALLAGTQ